MTVHVASRNHGPYEEMNGLAGAYCSLGSHYSRPGSDFIIAFAIASPLEHGLGLGVVLVSTIRRSQPGAADQSITQSYRGRCHANSVLATVDDVLADL